MRLTFKIYKLKFCFIHGKCWYWEHVHAIYEEQSYLNYDKRDYPLLSFWNKNNVAERNRFDGMYGAGQGKVCCDTYISIFLVLLH